MDSGKTLIFFFRVGKRDEGGKSEKWGEWEGHKSGVGESEEKEKEKGETENKKKN